MLTISAHQAGAIRATVHPMTVPAGVTVVAPPEPAGCPWSDPALPAKYQAMPPGDARIPRGCDWRDTSVWIRNASFPASPAQGTTYVYAHACRYHLCPLTAVQKTGNGQFTVAPGDTVQITTHTGTLDYAVCGVGSSPKSGPVVEPRCGAAPVDLMIITCEYDTRGQSVDNILIAATLRSTGSSSAG